MSGVGQKRWTHHPNSLRACCETRVRASFCLRGQARNVAFERKDPIERTVVGNDARGCGLGGMTMLLQITPVERLALQWLAEGRRSSDIAKALRVTETEMKVRMTTLL